MTEEKLIKFLSELKVIESDKNYARKSRGLILSSSKIRPSYAFIITLRNIFGNVFEVVRLTAVTAFGILLLLTIFGGVSYLNKNFSPVLLSGLDQKSLITEANEINDSINITLKEIRYLDNTNIATNQQIDQIANNKKTATIDTEPTSTSLSDPLRFDQKINELLEKASQ